MTAIDRRDGDLNIIDSDLAKVMRNPQTKACRDTESARHFPPGWGIESRSDTGDDPWPFTPLTNLSS